MIIFSDFFVEVWLLFAVFLNITWNIIIILGFIFFPLILDERLCVHTVQYTNVTICHVCAIICAIYFKHLHNE